jgi:PAS domain S-box-containing protein
MHAIAGMVAASDFFPHIYELRTAPEDPWIPALNNLSIAAAHLAIILVLWQVMRQRKETQFRVAAALFALFNAFRFATLVLGIWNFWHPRYQMVWEFRAGTAFFAVSTAIALVLSMPALHRLPSADDLEREIKERRQAEERAVEKEERLRNFVESVEDYAIYMLDTEGIVQSWNHGAERLKGYRAEEIIGQSIARFYTPEDLALNKPEQALRTAKETGSFEGEGWRVRKDGTRFLANVVMRPVLDAGGVLRGFSKVTRDLTESRELEAKYEMLLEATPDAIVIVDRAGNISYINKHAEELFGYSRSEVLGKSTDLLVPPVNRVAQAGYVEVLFGGAVHRAPSAPPEIFGMRKDGTAFPLEFSNRLLETKEGPVMLFAVRDLTERRKTEARFRALMESAPDALVISNSDGLIELTNVQAERLFGYTRAEMVGQPVDMLIPRDLQEGYRLESQEFFRGEAQRSIGAGLDLRARRKDGSEVPVEISFSPLEGSDGTSMTAAIRDITERKKSEARFRALLEAVPDAIVITGPDGRIQFVNEQTERLYGYPRAELLGQPSAMLAPEHIRDERVLYRDRLFAGVACPVSPDSTPASLGLRKDGSEFPSEFSFSPLETSEGQVYLFAIRDISERQKAEKRFRALLESAPDAMVMVNGEGAIQMVNLETEKLFGYSRTELVGKSVDILVPPSLHGSHAEHRRLFFENPTRRDMGANLDLLALRKDGTQFPVEISLSPLDGPDGISVTAAIRDITERRAAARQLAEKNAELHQSNEALEQFAHIASHDLQEPLRMVASYTQLLSRRYKGRLDAEADEFIAFAVDGTQRMKRLIEDLLLYSRAGKGAPPVVEFDANGSLGEALHNLRAAIEESGAEVTAGPLPRLAAVESQLVQLLQNLIGNAIKYRGDRVPRIHVSAAQSGQDDHREWVFSVADNGIGIDPRYFDRIFQIFQRLHGRGEYEGTGIGLAICKRILQQQGGRIWLESEPGVGSVFHFSLPVR